MSAFPVITRAFMLEYPMIGLGRGSYIAAKSVQNQRIERLWVDDYWAGAFFFSKPFFRLLKIVEHWISETLKTSFV